MSKTMVTLTGVVKRIHVLADNSCVAELESKSQIPTMQVNRYASTLVMIKGKMQLAIGVTIGVVGYWEIADPRYGLHLEVIFYWNEKLRGKYDVVTYLSSDLFQNECIGPKLAEAIWNTFKDDTLFILETEPGTLVRIPGIGPKRAAAIGKTFKDSQAKRELYFYLIQYGISPAKIAEIHAAYERPLEAIKSDPRKFGMEFGLDFETCDAIATGTPINNALHKRHDCEPERKADLKIAKNTEPVANGNAAPTLVKQNENINKDEARRDREQRQEDSRKLMEQYFTNYKVFIDTCSLLHEAADLFWENAIPLIRQTGNKIIVPHRAVDEIIKHCNNLEKPVLARKAKAAYQKFCDLHNAQLIEIRGESSDNFADNVFQVVFTKFRLQHRLLLITQDNGLALDILTLNNSKSQKGYDVAVKRINRYGYLSNVVFPTGDNPRFGQARPKGWDGL